MALPVLRAKGEEDIMMNPKTTILGYLALAAAVIHTAQAFLTGNYSNLGLPDIMAALGGVGLIVAKDGAH
jgi:hypothetical protein